MPDEKGCNLNRAPWHSIKAPWDELPISRSAAPLHWQEGIHRRTHLNSPNHSTENGNTIIAS